MEKDNHKFLRSTISFSGEQSETLKVVKEPFSSKLDFNNNLMIRGEYKLKMSQMYLLPASRFMLTVHECTNTNLS